MPRMRDAMRSGWNGSRPVSFSPTPANLIGLPVTWRTDSAAPPRASPSSLVRTTPVSGSALVERLGDVDRVLALHRVDDEQRLDRLRAPRAARAISRIIASSIGEPAGGVDDQHVVIVRARVLERARARCRPASRPAADGKKSAPTCAGHRLQLLDRRRAGKRRSSTTQHFLLASARAAAARACRWSWSCPSPAGRPSG